MSKRTNTSSTRSGSSSSDSSFRGSTTGAAAADTINATPYGRVGIGVYAYAVFGTAARRGRRERWAEHLPVRLRVPG